MRRHFGMILAMLLAGCGGNGGAVSDSTFVSTMTRLHVIDRDTLLDSAGRAAARVEVLQEEGLTPEELVEAARELADDPQRARLLFMEIDRRVDSMTIQDVP